MPVGKVVGIEIRPSAQTMLQVDRLPGDEKERTIRLPVQFPTSVAFGGENLDELYITSALIEVAQDQRPGRAYDGGLLRIRGIGKGLVEPKFAG
jgi:sugar lactone lactonase YvrE